MDDKLKAATVKLLIEALSEERAFGEVCVGDMWSDDGVSLTVEVGLWSELPEEGGMPPMRRVRLSLAEA